jgi:cytochrome-b5 reductase
LNLAPGQHIKLMFLENNNKEIVRNYTPMAETDGYFDLLIKVYPKGRMTQHLMQMRVGNEIYISKPLGSFDLAGAHGAYEGYLMLAGGTGITPLWQIIKSPNFREREKRLIFGNVTEEDILLRQELQSEMNEFFNAVLILNEATADWNGEVGFIDEEIVRREKEKFETENLLILICGPPAMSRTMERICRDNNWENFVF